MQKASGSCLVLATNVDISSALTPKLSQLFGMSPVVLPTRSMRVAPFKATTLNRSPLTIEANKRVVKKEKVILIKDVPKLGTVGQIVTVPLGFWRNYLLPQRVAKVASAGVLKQIEQQKVDAVKQKLEEKANFQAFANALGMIGKFVLKKKVGEKEQIFGSVTKADIAEAIYQQTGRSVADCEFTIPEIKTIGTYECSVVLHPEVTAQFNVVIQKEKMVQQLKVQPTPATSTSKKGKKK